MTKIHRLFIAIFLTVSIAATGQTLTTIGKAKAGPYKIAELSYGVSPGGDTVYIMAYKDITYTTINVWENVLFSGKSEVDSFYNFLQMALAADRKYQSGLINDKYMYAAQSGNSFGTKFITLSIKDRRTITGGVTELTEKQIEKLFNR